MCGEAVEDTVIPGDIDDGIDTMALILIQGTMGEILNSYSCC